MRTRRKKKSVLEGQYVAEVEVDLIDSDTDWSQSESTEYSLYSID